MATATTVHHATNDKRAVKRIFIIVAMLAGSGAFALDFNSPLEKIAGDFQFTEGPVWIAAKSELLFSDIPANRIIRFNRN